MRTLIRRAITLTALAAAAAFTAAAFLTGPTVTAGGHTPNVVYDMSTQGHAPSVVYDM